MIFLLLGRMKIFSAFTLSIAFKISSVLGFIVCPPSSTKSTPSPLNISLRPEPADTAMKPSLFLGSFAAFFASFSASFSLFAIWVAFSITLS